MTLTSQCLAGLAGWMLSLCALAGPLEISGISLEDTIALHGTPLQLNGAGTRYKTVLKVYVAALYLGQKAASADEAIALPGPKRISITLLRDMDANELGKSFTKAFENNAPKADMARLVPGLIRQGQIFANQKKLASGESFTIDWIPGAGTVISVKGAPQGEPIKELEFFNAMLRIWLGSEPVDWKLKDALLGRQP